MTTPAQGRMLEGLRQASSRRYEQLLRVFTSAPHPLPPGAIGHGIELNLLEAVLEGMAPPAMPLRLLGAVRERQLSHAAGRYCAELGLRLLTGTDFAVHAGPVGEPLWPTGVSGSITHAGGGAWAAVGWKTTAGALGLDTEVLVDAQGLKDILEICVTPEERRYWFHSCAEEKAAELATALFSAKESVFKAIFPTVGRFVEFSEFVLTTCCEDLHSLHLRPARSSLLSNHISEVTVRILRDGRRIHTSVTAISWR